MIRRGFVALLVVVAFLYPARAGATSWAFDFVGFHGITYSAESNGAGRPLTPADLGPVFDTVRFRILGTPCEYNPDAPECQRTEGVALSLPVGTPVYSVKGYRPAFRLAAYKRGALILFEAVINPGARRGGQLLDIGGKVRSIGIQSTPDPRTTLAIIRNRREVARLTHLIVRAPVNQHPVASNHSLFLIFHLRDRTASDRLYSRASGMLGGGITLPKAFATAITRAIAMHARSANIVSANVDRSNHRTDQEGFVSPPYPAREVHVREVVDLVANVRYSRSPHRTTSIVSWAVFRDGQEVFQHAREESVEMDEAAQTVRYTTPFAPAAPGRYRFRLLVTVHRAVRTWSGDFRVIGGLGPIGMTFRTPGNLDVTPTRASFERCLPGLQGGPPPTAKTGKVFLLTRWTLSNLGSTAVRVPDFHLVMPNGTTNTGSYAGYPGYMNPLGPKQTETLSWAWKLPQPDSLPRLTYGNASPGGRQGRAWFLKVPRTPDSSFCGSG